MTEPGTHPLDERPLIRLLVGEIEALRAKRKQQWRDTPHPEGKRWTQSEVRELACPSYHQLLQGTTQRLPSRALVLQIADYLECTIHETNDLLLAGQYIPKVVELRADEKQAALGRARTLMHRLPFPAAIVSRGLFIEDANTYYLTQNNLQTLTQLPQAQRTALHIACDPQLPTSVLYWQEDPYFIASIQNIVRMFKTVNADV